jgi:histidinol-phosphate phosphatase family protein
MTRSARQYLSQVHAVLSAVDPGQVDTLVEMLAQAWARDACVFICGNGGSASTANHMALDLGKQTMMPGRRALRAISLSANAGLLTAWGNDSDFSRVFAEQLAAQGRPGDVVVCISCSGNSPNIIAVLEEAEKMGIQSAGLGGFDGGRLRQKSNVYVHVPSDDYGVVESVHLAIEHTVADILSARAVARPHSTNKPVVMVDRDGVINRNLERGVRHWDDFEFLPGSLQALELLAQHGHRVVVVSNQAGVGRGHLTPAQLADINRRMCAEVLEHGGSIEAIYVCPHRPEDDCNCRKPAPGLLHRAAADLGFALAESYFVGDHASDVEAADAAGAKPLLVTSGRTGATDLAAQNGHLVADDLLAAADLIVSGRAPTKEEGVEARAG